MPSDKQIAANRRNSRKSTGPKSSAGKAASSMNALKTGLYAKAQVLPTEKAADFETLTAEYYDQFRPDTPEFRDLVDEFITLVWQLRRLGVTEVQMYKHEAANLYRPEHIEHPQGKIAATAYRAFAALQRRLDSTRRSRCSDPSRRPRSCGIRCRRGRRRHRRPACARPSCCRPARYS